MSFSGVLFRYEGPGGWTFVEVPLEHAPPAAGAWGRAPVSATVDGTSWDTSVWREKSGRWLLAVPAKVRGPKGDGDTVSVEIRPRS